MSILAKRRKLRPELCKGQGVMRGFYKQQRSRTPSPIPPQDREVTLRKRRLGKGR